MTLLGRIGMAAVLAAGLMGWSAPGQAQEADQDSALDAVRSLQNALGAPERGGECPPRAQALAHQVIALHTQLMVTSVACADIYGEPDLHAQYRVFTSEHADRIRNSQQRIQRTLGGEEAVEVLDQYLAEMANDEAAVIQQRSVALYCAMRNSRFHSLIDASPDSFGNYAEELTMRARVRAGC